MSRTTSRRISARPPALVLALALVGLSLVVLPLVGLVTQTPWRDLGSLLTSPPVMDALRLSLVASGAAALLSLLFGVPLAWMLARVDFRGKALVRGLVILPMVVPPVVGGAALLFAFGRRGIIGEPLYDATGFLFPFSMWGVILATTYIAMPFMVLTVEGGLRNLDQRYESAATTLGAKRWTVFRRITLPLIGPSLIAGLVLAWARALGEFGATITFAGNLQGRTQTMPLAVFLALEQDRGAAVAMSLLLVVVSLVVLVALRHRWWPVR